MSSKNALHQNRAKMYTEISPKKIPMSQVKLVPFLNHSWAENSVRHFAKSVFSFSTRWGAFSFQDIKRKGRYLTSVVSQWHLSSLSSSIYFFAPILCYLLLCFSKIIIALSRYKKRATFRSLSFIKCFFRQGKNLALCN